MDSEVREEETSMHGEDLQTFHSTLDKLFLEKI